MEHYCNNIISIHLRGYLGTISISELSLSEYSVGIASYSEIIKMEDGPYCITRYRAKKKRKIEINIFIYMVNFKGF